jgi:hypothetical protein
VDIGFVEVRLVKGLVEDGMEAVGDVDPCQGEQGIPGQYAPSFQVGFKCFSA